MSDVIWDLETEDTYSAKRQRLAKRQAQSPILKLVSTSDSTSLLNLVAKLLVLKLVTALSLVA